MPYQYRRATLAERTELRRQRIESGSPLHAPPHPFRQSGYYLITAANYNHCEILTTDARRTDFETRLLTAIQPIATELTAWVILPNHYHLLLGVETLDLISTALQLLHGATSHQWNLEDGQQNHRKVWYHFTDRYIRSLHQYYQAINYIHYNPVKHNYTADPYVWPWSSLPIYEQDNGRDWLRNTWKKHFPGDIDWE